MGLFRCFFRASWTLALLLAPFGAGAQETFSVKREVALRSAPKANAPSTPLPAETTVTRLEERQGPFRRVRTADGKTGWLHMFDLQGAAPAAAGGGTVAGGLRALGQAFSATPSASSNKVATSTVGIRGLDADDLAKANPNMAAVNAATQYKVSEAQARQFGQRAGFKPRTVSDLEAPPTSTTTGQAQ